MTTLMLWAGLMMATTVAAMPMNELDWRVVNDTVMGGVSQGTVETTEHVRFEGVLSLERNGGFASIRAAIPEGALVDATALRLVLLSDGRTYDLTLRRSDVPLRAGSYRVPVATEQGRTEVVVPLSAFRPTSFGQPVDGAPSLDSGLEHVDTIGLLLADKQPGAFAVELVELSVVRGEVAPPVDREPLLADLRRAVVAGVPLFNSGDMEGCRDVYASALGGLLEQAGLTPGEQALIEEALVDARSQPAREGAWTLRHAIDSVLHVGA